MIPSPWFGGTVSTKAKCVLPVDARTSLIDRWRDIPLLRNPYLQKSWVDLRKDPESRQGRHVSPAEAGLNPIRSAYPGFRFAPSWAIMSAALRQLHHSQFRRGGRTQDQQHL